MYTFTFVCVCVFLSFPLFVPSISFEQTKTRCGIYTNIVLSRLTVVRTLQISAMFVIPVYTGF